jgi:uncharacterized protein YjeT (DUF2065 family)
MNLDGQVLWAALALMLVFEGLLPFVAPARWRRLFEQVQGLVCLLTGCLALWLVL